MRKELDAEDFYNAWLYKYHNITVRELIEKEPELCKTSAWYRKYAVTQEQHDEWYDWAITKIAKHRRCSKKIAKKLFCFEYLNLSPSIELPS
jgi:hypothetical protein